MTDLQPPTWLAPPATYPLHIKNNEVHIWHFPLNATQATDTCWHALATEEKERAERFYFEKDRIAYLLSRNGLRSILSRYTEIDPQTIRFKYTPYGKPFLDPLQNSGGIYFNVSHTHQCVLYAFTKNVEIGIDVEYLKNGIDYHSIAKNFFSKNEYQTLLEAAHEQKEALFYKIWTCKEAFIKAMGLGLSYSLADFDVIVQENQPARILGIKNAPDEAKTWSLYSFIPANSYMAAIAMKQPFEPSLSPIISYTYG